jgi:hypothetical protein
MSVDSQESPSPVSNPSPSASQSQGKILTVDVHLHIRRGEEKDMYEKLKKHSFVLTPMFSKEFMQEAGLDSEFSQIFALLGWTSFYNTSERGSRRLTLEFICTLKSFNDGVTFWLFRQEHTLSCRKLSNALGFAEGYALDLDLSLEDFHRLHLWTDVTGKENAHKPRTNDIQHPTLCFFHKWISLVLFPCNDNISVRVGDMQLIYAALKRQVVSPVKMLVEHWLSFPNIIGDISCTSLITWIIDDLGILGDATIINIDTPREIIGYDYFRQGRWVKRIQEKLHHIHNKNAIPLPNPRLGIYSVQSFLINEQAQPVQQQPPGTSARASLSNYAGADPLPQDVAYRSYENSVPTYPRRAYQAGDLPSQGLSNLKEQEFGSGRFYALSSNFVPTRNSFSGFDHQYSAMFRQGVHENMRMQMSTQDTHTNMLRQQQQWIDQVGQRLEDIQETADANAELLARRSRQWGM